MPDASVSVLFYYPVSRLHPLCKAPNDLACTELIQHVSEKSSEIPELVGYSRASGLFWFAQRDLGNANALCKWFARSASVASNVNEWENVNSSVLITLHRHKTCFQFLM